MPRAFTPSRAVVVVLVAMAALTGCGGAGHRAASPPSPTAAAHVGIAAAAAAGRSGTTTSGGAAVVNPATGSTSNGVPAGSHPAGASNGSSTGQASDVPGQRGSSSYVWSVTAHVTPTCVVAGRTATVTVKTARNAALAYVAVYAGEKSGAAPPFGYGYGGNADGYSSPVDGSWANTWTVRADAPTGKARVTVVVAWHQTSKQVDVPFTVADPLSGTC